MEAKKVKNVVKHGERLAEAPDEAKLCSISISYSRKDKDFVQNLVQELKKKDERVIYFDTEEPSTAVDWMETACRNIERADAFVIVLSPDSIKSEMTNFELDHAMKNGKRLIPIVCRDVDYQQVRKELSTLNWIFFRPKGDDFNSALELLFKAVDAEVPHARVHTKMLNLAIDWQKHDFEKGYLLFNKDIQRAQTWLSAASLGKEPKPTTLHLSYIKASQLMDASMKKRRLIALFFAFIVFIGILWPSWGVFFFCLFFAHFFIYFSATNIN